VLCSNISFRPLRTGAPRRFRTAHAVQDRAHSIAVSTQPRICRKEHAVCCELTFPY
jgi:hypothetical protein